MATTDDLNIKSILFNKYRSLSKLCNLALKLKTIDNILRKVLSDNSEHQEIAQFCRIGNIENNYLLIETSRSEYLASLKFNTQDLLYQLRQIPEFAQIIAIKYRVCPELEHIKNLNNLQNKKNKENENKLTTRPQLTKATINSLLTVSETINTPELKQALIKLAQLGGNKNKSKIKSNDNEL